MSLTRLEIEHFRCLRQVELTLDPVYNLFHGVNASGKTSLLEALFLLGRGRSFRTRRLDRLITQGETGFRIVGWCQSGDVETVLGIGGSRSATEIRIGGQAARGAAELASHFPPQVIDPEIHKLLEEGPHRRRRFLDWGVFHVEPSFMDVWTRYHRALRQRNAALRGGQRLEAATAWEPELLAAGTRLADMRRDYLKSLEPALQSIGHALLDSEVTVGYHAGWPQDETFAMALAHSEERDRRYAATHVGPHRADITVKVGGVAAKERVSRGQQKLLASALTLAQLAVQEARHPGRSALLLDDPAAELDPGNLARLLEVVRGLRAQLFVTALSHELLGLGTPGAVFHVKQGTNIRQ